jgi:hypothetical protein
MFLICTIVILCFIFIKFIIGTFKWRATYRGENIRIDPDCPLCDWQLEVSEGRRFVLGCFIIEQLYCDNDQCRFGKRWHTYITFNLRDIRWP